MKKIGGKSGNLVSGKSGRSHIHSFPLQIHYYARSSSYYRLPTKLRKGIVFGHVCLAFLFTRTGSHVITTHDAIIQSQVTWEPPPLPSPLDILKHVYLGTSTFPDMFRLVHYEVPDICWQAGGWHSTEMPSCCFYLQKYEML